MTYVDQEMAALHSEDLVSYHYSSAMTFKVGCTSDNYLGANSNFYSSGTVYVDITPNTDLS
jgi:hypothetical protein